MSLITLTVKEKDTITYATAKSVQLDSTRVSLVIAEGANDSKVYYRDDQDKRVIEYIVDEAPSAVQALISTLIFENAFRIGGNNIDDVNVILINTENGLISSDITKEGLKRVRYALGSDNQHAVNRELDLGSKIIAASVTPKKFTVKGDQTAAYLDTATIKVNGSADNDGTFTISGNSALVSGNTEITVLEAVVATIGGFISKA